MCDLSESMRKYEEKVQGEFSKSYFSVIESLSYQDPIAIIKQLKHPQGTYKDCLSYRVLDFHKMKELNY